MYVRKPQPSPHCIRPSHSFLPSQQLLTPVETKIISRHWRDPKATTSSAAKSKQPKKTVATKQANQAADRSKLVEPVKSCDRTGAFGDFLRSLNLSPACDP